MSIQSEINRIAGAKSDIADAIEDKDVTVPSGTKLDGMANLIRQISGGSEKLNSTQAADAYDPTATYAVGDKVSYAGNVYSCISAISTPEAWDSTHWAQVDPIQAQVDDVRNTLTQLGNDIDSVETNVGKILPVITGSTNNSGYTINSGDYFEANGALYKATAAIPIGETWSTTANVQTSSAINLVRSNVNNARLKVEEILGATSGTGEKTLRGNYNDYKYIVLIAFCSNNTIYPASIPSNSLISAGYSLSVVVYHNNSVSYASVKFASGTTVQIQSNPNSLRIYGLKENV